MYPGTLRLSLGIHEANRTVYPGGADSQGKKQEKLEPVTQFPRNNAQEKNSLFFTVPEQSYAL